MERAGSALLLLLWLMLSAGPARAFIRSHVDDDPSVYLYWPDRVVPVGNAACAIEPIGGEGMGLALRSAQLAADALADAIERNAALDVHSLRRTYTRLWRTRALACRAAAWWVSKPPLCSIAVDVMRASSASHLVLGALGKRGTFTEPAAS